jgi:hypothetical protein
MKRRTFLKGGVAALGVGGARPSVVLGQAKPFAGVTINGACFQHVYQTYLQAYIPEFEERTGMKVNFTLQAFPVYNQRADLELSTKGSAWDFLNVTFIYSGRWIGAGWMTPLDEFVNDRNLTPAEWDFRDFVPGAQSTLQDAKGLTYGLAWEAGAMIMGASRGDLIEKAGLRLPRPSSNSCRCARPPTTRTACRHSWPTGCITGTGSHTSWGMAAESSRTLLCFLYAWNDFFFALILTRTEAMTAPVAVVNFMNYEGWEWGKIAAGGTLVMLPVLLFSFVVRRFLVRGLTAGALKG